MDRIRKRFFVPITKVNVERREVSGTLTQEVRDRDNEICDYASSKPHFESWSAEVSKITDGKSMGAVREMHQASAAGKIIDMNFDDADRRIQIVTKVVDDAAWEKVVEGVYTGFSMGGDYVRKWRDDTDPPGVKRFEAKPFEASLVDWPAVPTATFDLIKVGGATETRGFKKVRKPDQAHAVAKAILARGLAKGLWDISRLATLAQDLAWLQQNVAAEAAYEGDDSTVPGDLLEHLEGLLEALRTMTDEEIDEMLAQAKEAAAKVAAETPAAKAAPPNAPTQTRTFPMSATAFRKLAKSKLEALSKIVDHGKGMCALFGDHAAKLAGTEHEQMGKTLHTMIGDHVAKIEGFHADVGGLPEVEAVADEEHSEKVAKAASDLAAATATVTKVTGERDAALAEVETLKKSTGAAELAAEKAKVVALEAQLQEALEVGEQLLEKAKGTLVIVEREGDGSASGAKTTSARKVANGNSADAKAAADDAGLSDGEKVKKALKASMSRPLIDVGHGELVALEDMK